MQSNKPVCFQPVDVAAIVDVLETVPDIKYVGLTITQTVDHLHKMRSRFPRQSGFGYAWPFYLSVKHKFNLGLGLWATVLRMMAKVCLDFGLTSAYRPDQNQVILSATVVTWRCSLNRKELKDSSKNADETSIHHVSIHRV